MLYEGIEKRLNKLEINYCEYLPYNFGFVI